MKRNLPYLTVCLLIGVAPMFGQVKAHVNSASSTSGPSVSLSCTPSTTGAAATGFNFYRSTVSGGPYAVLNSSPVSTCAYTDTTVAFSTTYFYVATAVDAAGESGYSPSATATVPANPIPNPPTSLTVGAIVALKVPLYWNAPVPQSGVQVDSYNVYDCVKGGCVNPAEIATAVTTTSYLAHCKHANKLCFFQVRANDTVNGQTALTAASNTVIVHVY